MPGELMVPAARGVHSLLSAAGKHAPLILTIVAAGGAISSVISAVHATPKALILLEQKKKQIAREHNVPVEEVELTVEETVRTAGKCYIPAGALLLTSLGCMFGATHISGQRELGWAALYSATKKASDAYERQVIHRIGEKENREVHRQVAQEELQRNPVSKCNVVETGKGPYLCYDTVSGRYFMGDIENIRRVVNDLNQQMISCMYISLNEFYQELGLMPIDLGYDTGWNVDELIEINFSTMMSDDGRPCLVLQYMTKPRYSFNKSY